MVKACPRIRGFNTGLFQEGGFYKNRDILTNSIIVLRRIYLFQSLSTSFCTPRVSKLIRGRRPILKKGYEVDRPT
jgi:hypothetical protein